MRRIYWVLAGMVVMAGGLALGEDPGAATSMPAAADVEAATSRWQQIVKQLASADFHEREAAQKELEKANWRDREALKQLAGATADEEAEARLVERGEAIEEQMLIDPPPISVELKDANLTEVERALEKATGEKFPDPQGGFRGGVANTYTLLAKEEPFWEVFRDLSRQHGLSLQGWNGLRMMEQEPGMRSPVIFGGLAVFPMSLTRSTLVDLQKAPGNQVQPQQMNLQLIFVLDPRIKLAKYRQPRITEVVDDAGSTLYKTPGMPADGQMPWNMDSQNRVWNVGTLLQIPANPGKKITSVKGQLDIAVQLGQVSMEIEDVEKKLAAQKGSLPVTVNGQNYLVNQFEVKGNIVNFNIMRAPQGVVNRQDMETSARVTFIDANGQHIWSGMVQGGTSGSAVNGIVGPVKIEFSVATKTKEMSIPFELKDLPLP